MSLVEGTLQLKGELPAAWCNFVYIILRSYDYNIHVEGLMYASLCLITLLSLEQCSKHFRLQHVQIVNKTSSFKKKLIGSNAEASRVNAIPFEVYLSHVLHSRLPVINYCPVNSG